MKIGLIAESSGMESLKHVFQGLERSLAKEHEVVYRPLDYFSTPHQSLCEDFLRSCDVLVGRIDEQILKLRERLGGHPPLVGFLMGNMSRGAFELAPLLAHLKTTDVLVGNCTADLELVEKFFCKARMRNLPFAVDGSVFYPADEAERRRIKTELGFTEGDRILLYVGRITIEKNLHTVFRIFSVLSDLVPDLQLVVAGDPVNVPFGCMGVYPVSMTSTVMKLVNLLDLDPQSIHFVGRKNTAQLRDLYAASDVLLNMTLHHDENFGYSQVEAMACGTPVVGTKWGGLKDTILHGESGYQVSTVVTDSGVKTNWWEAINRIISLLEDDEMLARFRERCRVHALENFSHERYGEILASILDECVSNCTDRPEAIGLTNFADRFWHECMPREATPPSFQRGTQSLELYQEMITSFTGLTENVVANDAELTADHVLILAVPVRVEGPIIIPDDPIFPLEIPVPANYQVACEVILEIMKAEPAISFGKLEDLVAEALRPSLRCCLRWMFRAGLVLRTNPIDGLIDPENVGSQMSKPLFSIKSIDCLTTDVIVIK